MRSLFDTVGCEIYSRRLFSEVLTGMPTYEYECAKCGFEFERFQRISEEPVKRCPKCKGKVQRKIGAGAGLLFKGSGFYITDYRSAGYQKAESAAKSESAPAAAKESAPAKTESKKKPKGAEKKSS